ncbi:MAG: hypothetical protein J6W04_00135 [Bacteroidales bacterium]|nr:hypothetical protein [Bacteroidales bacterium]
MSQVRQFDIDGTIYTIAPTSEGEVYVDISGTQVASNATANILTFKYKNPQGQSKTVRAIRTFGDTESGANNGIVIIGSSSGNTIVSAGEQAPTVVGNKAVSNGESIYMIADSTINLWTNANTAANVVEALNIAANGTVTLATPLPIASGGTGASTAAGAVSNLGALPTTGGTLTGSLTVDGNKQVVIKDTEMTFGTTPSSSHHGGGIRINDSAGTVVVRIRPYINTSGETGVHIGGYNASGGTNSLYLLMDSSGNRRIAVSDAAAWRTGIGVTAIGTRPNYTVSSSDITAGTTALTTGQLYFVYE